MFGQPIVTQLFGMAIMEEINLMITFLDHTVQEMSDVNDIDVNHSTAKHKQTR